MARLEFDTLNATIRYLMFAVFAVRPGALGEDRDAVIEETSMFLKAQQDNGVVVRGG
jgi:peroxiredoxin